MATARRRTDRTGSKILDIHDSGAAINKRFRHFADGRYPNSYVVQESGIDTTTWIVRATSTGGDLTLYNAQKAVDDNDDWTQAADLSRANLNDWDLATLNARFIDPALGNVDDPTKNSIQRRRGYEGALIAFGVPRATAESLSSVAAPGFTARPKFDELGMTEVQARWKQIMNSGDLADADSLATAIADWRGTNPRDAGRAFMALYMLRRPENGGWNNLYLHITSDGFTWAGVARTDPADVINDPAHYDWEIVHTTEGLPAAAAEILQALYDSAEIAALKG